ncbi:MAG: C40 family peptidase [Hyphomicrobiaceae bacterium]
MQPPDKRLTPARADLAALHLQGKVEAQRFAEGMARQVARPVVALRQKPEPRAGIDTELLFGEVVTIYDVAEGWAWGQAEADGYVGYVPADVLSTVVLEPTHRVSAIGTFVYPQADIKAAPIHHLSINSRITVSEADDRFCRLQTGGYVIGRHVTPLARYARDFVEIAERLIGVPYLWGGRSRLGVDCSGLIQLAMQAAGLPCPRDSDMQQEEIGEPVLVPENLEGLQRGDLVFWPGHVGVMSDGMMLLHANAHHMAVVIEPLATAAKRTSRSGQEIAAIKRPAALGAPPTVARSE